jgi:hypothetical protein
MGYSEGKDPCSHERRNPMNGQTQFRRIVAISAIISAPVALATWILFSLAVGGDVDLDLVEVITLGTAAAGFLHLAWLITDLFGYMLLLAPVALYLWYWLKPRNPNLVTLFALFGFAYIFTGAVTVALMGGAVPPIMRAYAVASESERGVLLLVFHGVFDMVYYGVGPLAWLFGGLWWLGTGVVLRQERSILGITTIILGLLAIVVWLEQAFALQMLVIVETPFFFLIPIWSAWLGVVIWRRTESGESPIEATATNWRGAEGAR